MRYLTLVSFASLLCGVAVGQPTTDGSLIGDEAFYGAALSTQTTQTQFGDNSSADPILTADGGSEINQVFGTVSGGRLHVLITGNLETNFNKLEIYIDSDGAAGGVNTIDGGSLPTSVDGFCCGLVDPTMPNTDGALQRQDGLTFDEGFFADTYLTITNGFENVNARDEGSGAVDPDEPRQGFWAVSAHYADLTSGAAGASGSLGYQTAPRGLPQVLRNPMDYNRDGVVNAPDYTVWRDSLGESGDGLPADGNGDGVVDIVDYNNWVANFNADASLAGLEFLPSSDFSSVPQLAAGVTLPGLSQGELIDNTYALGAGGCTNNEGEGCVAEELEFALEVAEDETDNGSNHRLFENQIDLELAIDNSNVDGVDGGTEDPTTDPASATTGVEFSIPLSELGDPTGDIRLLAFINGTSHDFISNQFSGAGNLGNDDPLVGISRENLGNALFADGPDPALFTLADLPGDQFVTISQSAASAVPEPVAAMLVLIGGGLAATRRRLG